MPPLVAIGRFRYINAKIMSAGHDWPEENSFSDYSKMFDCKITWEMGVFNDSLSKRLTSLVS